MKQKTIKALVTIPPYAPYAEEVVQHEAVAGIRLNTVMPVKESLESLLTRLSTLTKKYNKELWVDLKCRQLRVATYGVPPFTSIELNHAIDVFTPCDAYFNDRNEKARVLEVDGRRLIMESGPKRVVGPGESVTIPHPTLRIKGYLTDTDKAYLRAGVNVGVNRYMLSFVEKSEDIAAVRAIHPTAELIAKIESARGLDYLKNSVFSDLENAFAISGLKPESVRKEHFLSIKNTWEGKTRLMAARGDLYMELHWPHTIIDALELILERDKNAIVASRILGSLAHSIEPSCEDIGDLDNLLRMGYKTVMFGDEICLKRDSIIAALNVFAAIRERYQKHDGSARVLDARGAVGPRHEQQEKQKGAQEMFKYHETAACA